MLYCYPKPIAIDEEPNDEIVHGRCLGKAYRVAHQSLNPGPQVDVLAFDLLRLDFANRVLLGGEMPLIGAPAIGVKTRDTKRCQQLFELQKNRILPPSSNGRQLESGSVVPSSAATPGAAPIAMRLSPGNSSSWCRSCGGLCVLWDHGQRAAAPPRAVGGHPPVAAMAAPPLPASRHALGALCPPVGAVPASRAKIRRPSARSKSVALRSRMPALGTSGSVRGRDGQPPGLLDRQFLVAAYSEFVHQGPTVTEISLVTGRINAVCNCRASVPSGAVTVTVTGLGPRVV